MTKKPFSCAKTSGRTGKPHGELVMLQFPQQATLKKSNCEIGKRVLKYVLWTTQRLKDVLALTSTKLEKLRIESDNRKIKKISICKFCSVR